jgi:hypothetical protein
MPYVILGTKEQVGTMIKPFWPRGLLTKRKWNDRERIAPPDAVVPRAVIYFLHIPKAAGSSVTIWLKERIDQAYICTAQLWDQLVPLHPSQFQRYRLFCGHFGADLEQFLELPLQTITVLRNPVLRTISHYHQVRRDPNHPLHHRVAPQSLDEFVRDRHNWPMIENLQARYLVRTPIDFTQYRVCFDRSPEKTNRLSVLAEDARLLLDRDYVRARSRELVERHIRVVGTTEQLPRFLTSVSQQFSLSPPQPSDVPLANAGPTPARDVSLTPETRGIITELTQIDQELWELCSGTKARRDTDTCQASVSPSP